MNRGPRRSTRPVRLAWLTIRLTAVVLAVLVLTHFTVTHIEFDVAETDARFVAERWRSGIVAATDWLMLVTAVLHGTAGAWVVVDESVRPGRRRTALVAVLTAGAPLLIALGTWALLSLVLESG